MTVAPLRMPPIVSHSLLLHKMADQYLAEIKSRRTCYSIEAKSPISDGRIIEIAQEVVKHTPSSFNCQSTRLVVLLKDEHVKFWALAKECFKATMKPGIYAEYEKKLLQRQAGYGTVSYRFVLTVSSAFSDERHGRYSYLKTWMLFASIRPSSLDSQRIFCNSLSITMPCRLSTCGLPCRLRDSGVICSTSIPSLIKGSLENGISHHNGH